MSWEKDRGYAWVVCFACFLIFVICDGVGMSYGVFVPKVQEELNCSYSTATFIGTLHMGVCYMASPIVAVMVEAFGYRLVALAGSTGLTTALVISGFSQSAWILALIYGVIAGLAMSMLLTTAEMILNQYFDKKLSLASALMFSGSSFGQFAYAPFSSYILHTFGLKEGFLAQGALTILSIFLGITFRTPISSGSVESHEEKSTNPISIFNDSGLWKSREFILFNIGYAFNSLSCLIPDMYIVSLLLDSEEIQVTPMDASFAVTVLASGYIVGHLLCALLDKYPHHCIKVIGLSSLASGVVLAILPNCSNLYFVYTLCGLFGFLSSPMVTLGPVSIKEMVGVEEYNPALSLNLFTYGVMILCGPPFVGLLVEYFQGYVYPFYLAAFFFGLGSVFYWWSDYLMAKNLGKSYNDEYELVTTMED